MSNLQPQIMQGERRSTDASSEMIQVVQSSDRNLEVVIVIASYKVRSNIPVTGAKIDILSWKAETVSMNKMETLELKNKVPEI